MNSMYSRARTDMFHRIASLILRFYGRRVVRNMKDTLPGRRELYCWNVAVLTPRG